MSIGKFISIEGQEGAGKTTLAKSLLRWLPEIGVDAVVTKELGGSPHSRVIRNIAIEKFTSITITRDGKTPIELTGFNANNDYDPRELALLFAASRQNVTRTNIKPTLAAGQWVICDRYCDTPVAVLCYGDGMGLDEIRSIMQFAHGDFKPDLTLLLDLPTDHVAGRLAQSGKGGDRYEDKDTDFMDRVRQGYLELARGEPERFAIIDATQSAADVLRQAQQAITSRLTSRM